jgi:uncharacterized membrane protein
MKKNKFDKISLICCTVFLILIIASMIIVAVNRTRGYWPINQYWIIISIMLGVLSIDIIYAVICFIKLKINKNNVNNQVAKKSKYE